MFCSKSIIKDLYESEDKKLSLEKIFVDRKVEKERIRIEEENEELILTDNGITTIKLIKNKPDKESEIDYLSNIDKAKQSIKRTSKEEIQLIISKRKTNSHRNEFKMMDKKRKEIIDQSNKKANNAKLPSFYLTDHLIDLPLNDCIEWSIKNSLGKDNILEEEFFIMARKLKNIKFEEKIQVDTPKSFGIESILNAPMVDVDKPNSHNRSTIYKVSLEQKINNYENASLKQQIEKKNKNKETFIKISPKRKTTKKTMVDFTIMPPSVHSPNSTTGIQTLSSTNVSLRRPPPSSPPSSSNKGKSTLVLSRNFTETRTEENQNKIKSNSDTIRSKSLFLKIPSSQYDSEDGEANNNSEDDETSQSNSPVTIFQDNANITHTNCEKNKESPDELVKPPNRLRKMNRVKRIINLIEKHKQLNDHRQSKTETMEIEIINKKFTAGFDEKKEKDNKKKLNK
jgi:hypothetical protein